jgi:dihydrofolate synthase/folylpolyglutamate synthase
MPAWTAARGEALAVLSRHAAAVGAPLAVFGRDFGLQLEDERDGEYRGRWWSGARREPFRLLGGTRVELQALALAAAALDRLFPGIALQLDPVPRPALPARFEIVARPDGPLVMDGAHTEESLAALAGELARRFPGHRWRALLASAAGKRWRAGFSRLLPLVDSVVVTAVTGTTSEDPWAIAGWLREQGVPAEVREDPVAAIRALLASAGPRLVTGSFYLVGRVHAELATSMGTTNA